MPLPHYLLAFAVALTWGLDYVAIGFAGVAVVAPWTMLVPVVSMGRRRAVPGRAAHRLESPGGGPGHGRPSA